MSDAWNLLGCQEMNAVDIDIDRIPKIQHELLVYINSNTEKYLMLTKVLQIAGYWLLL